MKDKFKAQPIDRAGINVYVVEQDGYKAVFHKKEHREMVTYLLAKIDGYAAMIQTLSKALSLIEQRR